MLEIEYHPAATDEVFRAFKWYDEVDDQVGQKFKLELARAERLVLRSPSVGGLIFTEQKGSDFVVSRLYWRTSTAMPKSL